MESVRGKIERNDYCPCGSGKKYKKCCMEKDAAQSLPLTTAYKNYKGEESLFNPREADKDVEKLKHLLDVIHQKREPGLKRALQTLQEIYDLFSALQSHFTAKASCEKGCSCCCHAYITVSRLEAELVKRFVFANLDNSVQDSFLEKIARYKNSYLQQEELELCKNNQTALDNLLDSYLSKMTPCPFLSEEGACQVYPARPFACRSLVVISDPEDCRNHKGIQIKPYNINDYVMASIANLSGKVFLDDSGEKQLPLWFMDGFKTVGDVS